MNSKIKIILPVLFISISVLSAAKPANAGLIICGGAEQVEQYRQSHPQPTAPTREATDSDAMYQQKVAAYNAAMDDYLNGGQCQLKDVFGAIAKLTNFLLAYAALFVIFRIVFVGYTLVFSGGDEHAVAGAKKKFFNVWYGFMIIMLAYILVNTIFQVFQVDHAFSFPFNPFS